MARQESEAERAHRLIYELIHEERGTHKTEALHYLRKNARDNIKYALPDLVKHLQKFVTGELSDDDDDRSKGNNDRWSTDKRMAEDFKYAVKIFLDSVEKFWPDDMEKDYDEIQDYLLMLHEDKDEYDDLTDKQKGLLGIIRRAHNDWVRKSDKRR